MRKIALIMALAMMLLAGCDRKETVIEEKHPVQNEVKKVQTTEEDSTEPPEFTYSTWVAYWDYANAFQEIDACGDKLKDIAAFEALYTGADYQIWFPEETKDMIAQLKQTYQGKKRIFLSFVNDFRNEDGSYSQKDVKLLEGLVGTEEARKKAVAAMVEAAASYGVDGIELDYENLKKAEHLKEGYAEFVKLLYNETQARGLALRVDIENDFIQRVDLPQGPQYVLMCYNLYGYGTGPGPKADRDFLQLCAKDYKELDSVTMAFSTGGFDWKDGEVDKALTEEEARLLYQQKCGESQNMSRDEDSRCAVFSYEEDGASHEVWFADDVTLNYWKEVVAEYGYYDIAIWRMNGNSMNTLERVTTEK